MRSSTSELEGSGYMRSSGIGRSSAMALNEW
jgi:hypothetical protein